MRSLMPCTSSCSYIGFIHFSFGHSTQSYSHYVSYLSGVYFGTISVFVSHRLPPVRTTQSRGTERIKKKKEKRERNFYLAIIIPLITVIFEAYTPCGITPMSPPMNINVRFWSQDIFTMVEEKLWISTFENLQNEGFEQILQHVRQGWRKFCF